jgi:hypothetical protein
MHAMQKLGLLMSVVAAVTATVTATQPRAPDALSAVLQRAGERVERFLARAQSIVCRERVHLQPLTAGWSSDGLGRTVESELRLSWEAANGKAPAEARTLRQLLTVNGRKPRKDDWNNCTTPEQQSQEPHPISLLLPGQRTDYQFASAGHGQVDRRAAVMVDYRLLKAVSVESSMLEGRDDCVTFDVEGGMRGRLWIDVETYDVLRLDQHLSGMVEIPLPRAATRRASSPTSWTMERWDTSIRFRSIAFENPDETLVLPVSLSSITITRGSGTPRLRTTTEYTNYQRFLTGGRVIGD